MQGGSVGARTQGAGEGAADAGAGAAQTCEHKSGVQAPGGGAGTGRHRWWWPERAAGMEAGDAGARVEQRVRGGAQWALEHGCARMTRQGWSKHGADASGCYRRILTGPEVGHGARWA
jgi:hypothetical protein